MLKYIDNELRKEMLLGLNLITWNIPDDKKIMLLYTCSNNIEDHYRKIEILKKDGSMRQLLEPDILLKHIQRNILNNILKDMKVSKCACAYRKGYSIIDNVKVHLNQKVVVKMDIEDFFTNITSREVLRVVFPSKYFPSFIGVMLTNLCVYYDYLPQGASTSPYISNLIMRKFDDYVEDFCKGKNINYTRYSDDLTFSGDFDVSELIKKVKNLLYSFNFRVNYKKTKVIYKNGRQIITGIVVNDKFQVSKNYRKKVRQEIYYCQKYGVINHQNYLKNDKKNYLEVLLGKVNFILLVNSDDNYFRKVKNYLINEIAKEKNASN